VEKILASRRLKGLEYLVLWVGYVLEESTWEPKAHLKNSSELIEEFYAINPAKPGGPEDPRRRNKTKMKLEAAKNVRESKAAAAAAPAVAATAAVEQPIVEEVSDDVNMD
jgi:Tfp pilus assembly protein PilE